MAQQVSLTTFKLKHNKQLEMGIKDISAHKQSDTEKEVSNTAIQRATEVHK